MKKMRLVWAGMAFVLAIRFILQAQETGALVQNGTVSGAAGSPSDFDAELQALERTTPIPASQLPGASGIQGFYSAQNPSWPPLPGDVLGLPAWPLGGGLFVLDDVDVNYAALAQQCRASGLMPMDSGFTPAFSFSTNSLWLQMLSVTNGTASLVIHPPWNVANGVYDLLYCTNLGSPAWQWLLRSDPGQSNLVVPNATDAHGFYRLGLPNDLIANDSLGTNFWLAFFSTRVLPYYPYFNPSLYISSPVAASGTVTYPVNGPVLTITGDPTVNGTYILTNMPASETNDFIGSTMYMNEANTNLQVVYTPYTFYPLYWEIWSYDPTNSSHIAYYAKPDPYLNGTNWARYIGTGTVTSSCPQVLFSQPFSVTPGMVTNVPLPLDVMLYQFDAVESQGIHVTASQPVSVYGFDYYPAASTAFTAYPTPMLGTNYCVMARASSVFNSTYHSQFAIVGTVANTTVTITPSTNAGLAGSMWTNSFILNQGNTYQINSSNIEGDVTGTWITSDKPIAVFAGADLAYVPGQSTQAGNPLNQEQLPVEQWGTNVVAMSFAGRTNGDSYRILAAYSNTVITVTGVVVTVTGWGSPVTVTKTNETVTVTNQAGRSFDIIVDGPVQFQSTKPIQVAQFANGSEFDCPPSIAGNPNEADPCEILLLPVGHYLTSYVFFTLDDTNQDFDENFLNLIVPQSATNATLVDGSLVSATNFVAIGTSGYYGAQIAVTNSGVHTVTSSQPIEVQVYGWGQADAYGYFGGMVK
jgi:hypothetical protein